MSQPWEIDWSSPQAAPRGGATLVPLPEKPKTATPQTPAQAEKDALEVVKLKRELAKTPETDPGLQAAIKGLGLDELLTSVVRAREHVGTGWATGIPGSIADLVPGSPRRNFKGVLGGLKGAVTMEKLQALKDASKTGASGMGSLTEQEGERLASSVAALADDMSQEEIEKSLDIVERHARFLQAVGAGKDPNDPAVQEEFGIKPLPGAKEGDGSPGLTRGDKQSDLTLADLVAGRDKGEEVEASTTPLKPSTDGTRTVIDPKAKAIGDKIAAIVNKGADRNAIMGFAVGLDPSLRSDPKFRAWVDEAIQFRKDHPKAKFKPDASFYTRQVPLSDEGVLGTSFGSEQDLNKAAQSPIGAGFVGGADTAMAGTLDEAVGMLGGDQEAAQRAKEAIAAGQPTANFLGQLGGGTAAALSGEALLARLGMAPGAGRAMLADTGFGAAYGAGSAGEGDRLSGAAFGGAAGLGGNLVGRGVTNTLGRLTAGVSSPEVRALINEKIPLTIGQAVGKSGRLGSFVKGTEDRLAGIGLDAGAINARRAEGVAAWNAKTFDHALKPINQTVGDATGEEAVDKAQQLVSDAFKDALQGKTAKLDRRFITESAAAKNAIEDLGPRLEAEVNEGVDQAINSYFDDTGNLSGDNMQALLRELGQVKRGYAGDPLAHRVTRAVGMVEKSIENLFRRQAPEVIPKYDAAKEAFRRLSVVEDAVLRGKNTGGKFTPGQLGMSARSNSKKFDGNHAAAAGKGPFHDYQRTAQEVMPNQVPDSGTAGRLIVPAALIGAGTAGGAAAGDASSGAGVGLGLAGLLALAYSKAGQRALVGAVTKRGPGARAAGKAIKDRARLAGAGGATTAALGTSRDQ